MLAGHSMGTGEVTRYLGRYGSARVAKGVLVSPIPPYLLQAGDNPDGVPHSLFDGFAQAARADTPAWMKGFLDTFYNMDTLRGTLVSEPAWQATPGQPKRPGAQMSIAMSSCHLADLARWQADSPGRGPAGVFRREGRTSCKYHQSQEAAMSAAEVQNDTREAATATIGLHLEVEIIPVSDPDRSKEFYQRLGWRLDDDVAPLDGLRIIQFTPPGSAASITFGTGLTTAAPGSAGGGLTVTDIEAAHDELARRTEVSEIWHGPPFPVEARQPGPHPERASYGSFFSIADPDGNTWLVQEVTTRLPGR